ncbi:MAG: PLP-dependent transferase [Myxococcales bacterium]|nr:PLP-dependent transferase [Myxococcales bacterium]
MSHRKYVLRPETAVLTRGFDPKLSVGSARPAVFRSSTYVFSSPESAARAFDIALGRAKPAPDESVDLIYSRLAHPNAQILEDQVVPLERDAADAAVFNSGMAAISSVFLTFCPPGSTVVHTTPLYGGTQLLLDSMMTPLGVKAVTAAAGDTQGLAAAIALAKGLKLVFLETPANPTLTMTDIAAAVQAARAHPDRPLVVVDNTFLGPSFQHPLTLGADLCVYSATKYLNGFSDLLAGLVLAKNGELVTQLRGTRAVLGNILQPDECWLLNTRLPTVPLRMNKQSKSAQRLAEAVHGHRAVAKVHYPTLFEDQEQQRIRDAQCDYPGGIVTLELKGGRPAAFTFLRSLRIFHNAVSLGGVESLACHPRTTTHSEMTVEQLDAAGITEGLVRLSTGIESWHDLLVDVKGALDAAA